MKAIRFIMTSVLVLCWAGAAPAASQRSSVKQGNALYEKGDYPASIEKYEEAIKKAPESDIVNFNAGTAYYKNQDFQQAITHTQKALLSEDPQLKARAHYNLGNALYRAGIAQENKDIQAAIQDLQQALSQYEGALKINDKDEDARYNYEFVKKELKRLEQKQQQQQQNKQQDQQSSSGQDGQQQEPSPDEDPSEQARQQERQDRSGEENKEKDQQAQGQKPEENQPKSEEQEKQDQQPAGGEDQQQSARPQTSSGQGAASQKGLTQREARMMLEDYQQTEEPKGMVNFIPRDAQDKPVTKDW